VHLRVLYGSAIICLLTQPQSTTPKKISSLNITHTITHNLTLITQNRTRPQSKCPCVSPHSALPHNLLTKVPNTGNSEEGTFRSLNTERKLEMNVSWLTVTDRTVHSLTHQPATRVSSGLTASYMYVYVYVCIYIYIYIYISLLDVLLDILRGS
jgi:hypothetical protein